MKRPWQIWLLYALGLAGVAAAFGWLTVKALWRMDALLTPLLAEEAARPDFVYHPVYPVEQPEGKGAGKPSVQRELSPLLANPPQYVLLHFEVHADGSVTSPQNPTGDDNAWALKNGVSPELVNI